MCGQVDQPRQPGTEQPSTCQRNEPSAGWWVKGFGYFGDQGAQDGFTGYNSTHFRHDDRCTMHRLFTCPSMARRASASALAMHEPQSMERRSAPTPIPIPMRQRPTSLMSRGRGSSTAICHLAGMIIRKTGTFWYPVQSTARRRAATADRPTPLSRQPAITSSLRDFTITPLASLQYTHMNLDSYTETGAAPLNLSVNSQSYDFLESALGVTASRAFSPVMGRLFPKYISSGFMSCSTPECKIPGQHSGSPGSRVVHNAGAEDGCRYAQSRRRPHVPVVLVHCENMVARSRLRLFLEK